MTYSGGCERQRIEDAFQVFARQGYTLLKDKTPRKRDTPLHVVVVNPSLVATAVVSVCSHPDDLVFVDLASRTRTLGQELQGGQQHSVVKNDIPGPSEGALIREKIMRYALFNIVRDMQNESRKLTPLDAISADDNVAVNVDVHEVVVEEE